MSLMLVFRLFFFASRRRHTIYWRDWSSDVCSSDLEPLDHRARAARAERLVVAAVDGSQIEPDFHEMLGCCLINVGWALFQIGRGSCRERGEISVVGVS